MRRVATEEELRSRWDSYEPRADKPAVNSKWLWEKDNPDARETVAVVEVRWNGEEWWVLTSGDRFGRRWNDLSRFWEASWPDPDPNVIGVGQEIVWNGAPSFARTLPSGWQPQNLGSRRSWSKVGEDMWRRVEGV